jgi:hypothetical protein
MEEFTTLNRSRNRQIIDQSLEITALLNQHGIDPVFLKGTAHLLDGLYEDPAERMVGDIDLLVEEKEMVRAAEILIDTGYKPLPTDDQNLSRMMHYPRLTNEHRIAAVEVHRQVLPFPQYISFEFKTISEKLIKLNIPGNAYVLEDKNQILYNIMHLQHNHLGYYYAEKDLRQGYDLLLLSQRENPLKTIVEFRKFFHLNNANLALNNLLFCQPDSLPYKATGRTKLFMTRINLNLNYSRWELVTRNILHLFWKIGKILKRIVQSIYDRVERQALRSRLKNPQWYRKHLESITKKDKAES